MKNVGKTPKIVKQFAKRIVQIFGGAQRGFC